MVAVARQARETTLRRLAERPLELGRSAGAARSSASAIAPEPRGLERRGENAFYPGRVPRHVQGGSGDSGAGGAPGAQHRARDRRPPGADGGGRGGAGDDRRLRGRPDARRRGPGRGRARHAVPPLPVEGPPAAGRAHRAGRRSARAHRPAPARRRRRGHAHRRRAAPRQPGARPATPPDRGARDRPHRPRARHRRGEARRRDRAAAASSPAPSTARRSPIPTAPCARSATCGSPCSPPGSVARWTSTRWPTISRPRPACSSPTIPPEPSTEETTMRTPICDDLNIEFPIFAFTHCRDVVVAVAKAGGFGVLGAVGFSPEQLEIELQWIDEHIGDRPYGVDIVIPNKYEGMDANMSGDELAEMLRKMVPQENLDFARKLLADHGVPLQDESEDNTMQLLGWTEATATPAGGGRAAPPEDDADRQRARHAAARGHGPHPQRGPQGRGAVRLAVPGPQARRRGRRHHHRPGRRRAAVTAARSAPSCCGPRSSRRWRRFRCSPPAASAAASRSRPRSRSGARVRGRARSG